MSDARYNVLTWDTDLARYTPQAGMRNPCLAVDIAGLRKALRELRDECGYNCEYCRDEYGVREGDPCVMVERIA